MVAPTQIYGPNCVSLGIPASMVAGVEYTFEIQGRDFYENNIQDLLADAVGEDYQVTYHLIE